MSIKLLMADDHQITRDGMRKLIEGTDIQMVAEAPDGSAVDALVEKHKPDVVLLDIRMEEGDGLAALTRLKAKHPELPVLMMSLYDNPSYIAKAVALGASGYFPKEVDSEHILATIRKVADGANAWTREELRRVTGALATPRLEADIDAPLTQRETEVLRKMTSGATNKEIAVDLSISYETVKEHVQHILNKLGLTDRTQAAVWAVRKNLV
ncbi:MAG: response regulator [Pirellulales bacterium]